MKSVDRSSIALAIWLSALAGYVDALGFLHLGGYFVSFMSGNSTRLAVALQEGNGSAALLLAQIISLFITGAMTGALIGHYADKNRRPVVLGSVTLLLMTAAILSEYGFSSFSVCLMVLAMGAENAIFQKNGDVLIGLTYMTGTLVKIGQKLAASILGKERHGWVPYLFLWLGLIGGGLIGAFAYSRIGLHGLWFAAGAGFCLTLAAARQQRSTSLIS